MKTIKLPNDTVLDCYLISFKVYSTDKSKNFLFISNLSNRIAINSTYISAFDIRYTIEIDTDTDRWYKI